MGRDGAVWRIVEAWQSRWDRLKLGAKSRLDAFDPLELLVYRGHGGNGKVRVLGRLIEHKGVEETDADASVLRKAVNTIRRFESDEIPDARVVARFRGLEVEGSTDHEGFFELTLEPVEELDPGWHEVEVELLESMAGGAGMKSAGRILVPPRDAEFAIISDIDDTVLETRATDLLTELRLIFSKSPEERSAMPGSAPLYRKLNVGADEDAWNPFFYVSRSGWGLYDLIEAFLEQAGLPEGPIYLQDIAIIEPKSSELGAEDHKRETVGRILGDYPELSFVLIGDSGQQDPETYRDIVREHDDRIRAVLIRDVAPPARDAEVREIVQEIIDMGVDAAAAESSVSLARAAADFGLIAPDAIAEVREQMVRQER